MATSIQIAGYNLSTGSSPTADATVQPQLYCTQQQLSALWLKEMQRSFSHTGSLADRVLPSLQPDGYKLWLRQDSCGCAMPSGAGVLHTGVGIELTAMYCCPYTQ